MKRLLAITLSVSFFLVGFSAQIKLIITSSAFTEGGIIPVKYSCEGTEVNPPLKITGIPGGAKSLAVIVHDPDAPEPGGVTHWLLWNLSVKGRISENFRGAVQGLNSSGKVGYKGMCPPSGTHHYHFKVYALDTTLQLDTSSNKDDLEKALQGHILAQGELVGLYSKAN